MNILKDAISGKTAVLGVIGLGYVGLPLAVEKAHAGFKVLGLDVDSRKVDMVNSSVSYIGDVNEGDLRAAVQGGLLTATCDMSMISKCDCVCICVPTPLDDHQQPDISFVKISAETIAKYIRKGMLVVLESTTYPGTTRELLLPILESSGLKCGVDFHLAFSPERVDPGNKRFKTNNTPKVVGGMTAECTEIAAALYESVLQAPVYKVSSPDVAEMEKILENTYRNINIGLINELAVLCEKMNIDIWEVVNAAKTKPYGFQAFYPGPGLGGHCIPLDPYYLAWKAREYGVHTTMIEASMTVNDKMPEYCVTRAMKLLNAAGKPMNGSKMLVLGIAYKQNIDDYRESPALKVMELSRELGADVVFYDGFVDSYREHKSGKVFSGESELTAGLLESADIVVVATAHTNVDYDFVQQHAKCIFDARNAMKDVKNRSNIELL